MTYMVDRLREEKGEEGQEIKSLIIRITANQKRDIKQVNIMCILSLL